MNDKLKEFIDRNWDKCIRENRFDNGTLIGLPYPYSVPNTGVFDEMYYWDTYFTNVGLILWGRALQAKQNVDNMLYIVNRFGFMLNGNRTYYLYNTQPPFLSEMVKDIYSYYGDSAWLNGAYAVLKKEYAFWMNNRISPIGLNMYYGNEMPDDVIDKYSKMYCERTGYPYSEGDKKRIAHHCMASAESGWDMNPRFDDDAYNFVPVDLNSLMYGFEMNMAFFASELGESSELWEEKAQKRKKLMIQYMTSDEGILFDYNYQTKKLCNVFSVASLYPMFVNMMDEDYAKIIADNFYRLKGEYGVFTCEKNETNRTYQWNYPNGWPCMQHITIKSFDNYGYKEIATKVAKDYVGVAERNFEKTGNLWEKYNMVDGSTNTQQEFVNKVDKLPEMMGWTAGSYIYAKKYLGEF